MLSRVMSGAVVGLEAVPVEVEVDIASQGFPAFSIVGLPDKAIEEAKDRVRSALTNSSAPFPNRRITVNLSPADLPKSGPAYDFPISLGILLAYKQLPSVDITDSLFLGEVSLDGTLRTTPGVISLVGMAKEQGFRKVFLPSVNASEASLVEGIAVYPVHSIAEIIDHFQGTKVLESLRRKNEWRQTGQEYPVDFADIVGQDQAKRAMIIAAAGGHNISLTGPAGSGKTLLARALPSILPPLSVAEALEVTKIASITGNLPRDTALITLRPFRSPHHTVSRAGLIGGGTHPLPGEISMAHRGVLFLDEFPEYPRHVLEALRQPLEDGVVTVSRARMALTFPANFMLVTAQNPCPCGNYGHAQKDCTCSPQQILNYQRKISGPMQDRIDLHVYVPAVEVAKLSSSALVQSRETSVTLRAQVIRARERQQHRYQQLAYFCNADITAKIISNICSFSTDATVILNKAISQFALSARSYHKVIKIALTIADLDEEDEISACHVSEALQYRAKD